MKNLLIPAFLLIACLRLQAQNDITKGEIKIRATYMNVLSEHDFLIDVDIIENQAKITYISYDSVQHEKVRKDPQYQDISKRIYTYKNNDPKSKLAWDTLGRIFEKHRIHTRDSKNINLKKDTTYRNLLNRVLTASKDELSPDINANAKTTGTFIVTADGGGFNLAIVAPTGKRGIDSNFPELGKQPLLFNFLKTSLGKKSNSRTVKNILKNYPTYK
jgi:hypothetical protein